MDDLLPCPFCKRTDRLSVERHPKYKLLRVQCRACGCIGPSKLSETTEEAINNWNDRVSDWELIETAPKDGTRILAWSKEWTGSHTAQFYTRYGKWGCFDMYFDTQPTHWMKNTEPFQKELCNDSYRKTDS